MRARHLALGILAASAGCAAAGERAAPAAEQVTSGPSIPWTIADVSDDARTVAVSHEEPHCETRPGRPQVTERERFVVIRIPLVRVDLPEGVACTQEMRYTTSRVALARPLGRRRLRQSNGRPARLSKGMGTMCPRLLRAPRDAPLFDVPLFAREVADCRRPVPGSVLALPIMQHARTSADRLTRGEREDVRVQPFYLRADLSRAARIGRFRLRLVPGAEQTCLFARFSAFEGPELTCASSVRAGRRGLFAEDVCADRTPPRRVRVLGVAPPGVAVVTMTRKGRTVASAPTRGGVYVVRGNDPTRLHVGGATLRLRGATTPC
ncbi:MAG TPA: hypothetical protein VF549_11240 [Solirubrobacteraceae bacterium]